MKKLICFAIALSGALCRPHGHRTPPSISPRKAACRRIAIPDFRGAGDAQKFMAAFNETLSADVKASGRFKLVPKTSLPLFVPQQPSDFQQPAPRPAAPARGRKQRAQPQPPTNGGGRWMQDWSSPPAQANHLAFGYTAAQNGSPGAAGLALRSDARTPRPTRSLSAIAIVGTVDEAGARKVAHEFAADIIASVRRAIACSAPISISPPTVPAIKKSG